MTLTKEAVEKCLQGFKNDYAYLYTTGLAKRWLDIRYDDINNKIVVFCLREKFFVFKDLPTFISFVIEFINICGSVFDPDRKNKFNWFLPLWEANAEVITEDMFNDMQKLDDVCNTYNLNVETSSTKLAEDEFDSLDSLSDAGDCGTEKEIACINEEIDKLKQEVQKKTDKLYARWCPMIMDKIEEIAKKHYPDMPYWCDTGSRCNVVLSMLDQFDKDMK